MKRFEAAVEEVIYHYIEVEVEDADGDNAVGYSTFELLDAVRAEMKTRGHDYHIDGGDLGSISLLEEVDDDE